MKPFDKMKSGKLEELSPVRHSFFYFRNPNYLNDLNDSQKMVYTNKNKLEDEELFNTLLAKSKDIIFDVKEEFEESSGCDSQITIRQYDGIWDNDLDRFDVVRDYVKRYCDINATSFDDLIKIYNYLNHEDTKGCFNDFKYDGDALKDVIIDDFKTALKLEFPENFN